MGKKKTFTVGKHGVIDIMTHVDRINGRSKPRYSVTKRVLIQPSLMGVIPQDKLERSLGAEYPAVMERVWYGWEATVKFKGDIVTVYGASPTEGSVPIYWVGAISSWGYVISTSSSLSNLYQETMFEILHRESGVLGGAIMVLRYLGDITSYTTFDRILTHTGCERWGRREGLAWDMAKEYAYQGKKGEEFLWDYGDGLKVVSLVDDGPVSYEWRSEVWKDGEHTDLASGLFPLRLLNEKDRAWVDENVVNPFK